MSDAVPGAPPASRLEVTLRVPRLGSGELWELMWRSRLVPEWMGEGTIVPTRTGERLSLADRAGSWRRGRVVKVRWGLSVEVVLDPAEGWGVEAGEDQVTVSISPDPEDGVSIRIVESGPYVETHRVEIELYWRAVLARLDDLVRKVNSRRDNPRQAIIVIHGIGEQEPGRTLRALAASGVVGSPGVNSYVKPDRVSDSFELRQVTFESTQGRTAPTTDVYELYWAHLIRDTTIGQVVEWARRLLFRWTVPRPLRPVWVGIWALLLVVMVGLTGQLVGLWDLPRWLAGGGLVLAVVALVWRVVGKGVVLNVLGDAARYLSPRPSNVAKRQAIRQAGVDLLERLHDRGTYDRIVVLGHSLGSVIAYDVLTYSWIRMQSSHRQPARPGFKPLRALERGITESLEPDAAQALQHAAWQQVRRNTQPWLVTDLVTVGSPLTYADFLMARNREEFRAAQRDRILPTCPPCTDLEPKSQHQRCSYETDYVGGDERAQKLTFTVFDSGALLAVTRWTNLFFTSRWCGLKGDLVGGPVAGQFGAWVRDVPLPSPVRWFAHTSYWRGEKESEHLMALRAAIAPESGGELLWLGSEIPAYVIAERVTRAERP